MKKKNSKNYYNVRTYGKSGSDQYTVLEPFKQAVKNAKTASLRDPENMYCVEGGHYKPGSVWSVKRGHYQPKDSNCPIYVKGQRVQRARKKKPNVGKGR